MNPLRTEEFYYHLPREYIAQYPSRVREEARLLVYHRKSEQLEHTRIAGIGEYLQPGSLLVLNDTRVFPARLVGLKKGTGGRVELLLLRELPDGSWETLMRPSARLREGLILAFPGNVLECEIIARLPRGRFLVRFAGVDNVPAALERLGMIPLPPYIKRPAKFSSEGVAYHRMDNDRYQTVYAATRGAVAAPTAGLHFSRALLTSLRSKGVEQAFITLHVGEGTFSPVRTDYVEEHELHSEYFSISSSAAEKINNTLEAGKRVVTVGTTCARALEASAGFFTGIRSRKGWTNLFIYPPYRFKVVRNLLTNFHLPSSSLIMLVAALIGREKVLKLYEVAKAEGYRFYSYGDAMLILDD